MENIMKSFVKSLFKGSSKDRGIPDRIHHPEYLGHNTTQGDQLLIDSILTPTSASAASSSVDDHPMGYPYQSQDFRQDGSCSEAGWELTVGNSDSKGGIQKVGNIKVGNCFDNTPLNLQRRDRVVLKFGNISNDGGQQEVKDVELGDIRV